MTRRRRASAGSPGLVHAEHALGEAINGNGDSGGPVVSIGSNGKLLARGVISGQSLGGYLRPCVGYVFAGRQCAMDVYYADLRSTMNAVGVHINTA
ncbi:hypothetical protein AB0K00_25350 [Dactylosporangium sp. NPDC049525]|uniref:hypothetical protein n=1 Tax=Dactylosporangium sp. NPDC049525 TaxID=3154730 RepID=UPI00343E6ABA